MRGTLLRPACVLVLALLPVAATVQEKKLPKSSNTVEQQESNCDGAEGNLVANCGFESGDFTGWDRYGDLGLTYVRPACASSGGFGACLGPVDDTGYMMQFLPTTPGQGCSLSFNLWASGRPNRFEVWWNGALVYNAVDLGDFDFRQVAFPLPAATTESTDLWFGFYNLPSFLFLDDIVVTCP